MRERRRFYRVRRDTLATLCKEDTLTPVKVYDLGAEGAGLISFSPLKINEKVKLLFPYKEEKILFEGRIVWARREKKEWWAGMLFYRPRFLLISSLIS